MRRFIDTFAGKALCHLVAMALVVPTVTLTVASRAKAQVTQLPSWAVTEFKDLKGANSFKYGQVAADAVASELAKSNRYDVVAQDTVKRSIETLGLTAPLDQLVNLSRVGQDVRANTIVAGEVIDYQVREVGGGKQGRVAVRAVAYDVVSGLPVNGALEEGDSTVRGGNITNEALIDDAISQAAALVVRTMSTQQASTATVLNTTERLALINQGARSGFKTGDSVIITRGALQIGTGRIGAVEPDQAEMTPERVIQGVAPGDRIRTVFSPPPLPVAGYSVFTDKGLNVRNTSGRRRGSNNATIISALLVLGVVGVLLGANNNSNSTSATSYVTAQATLDTNSPAVYLQWSPNGFYKGTGTSGNGVARWQIYRSDVSPSNPVLVIGDHTTVVDSSLLNNSDFPNDVFQSNQVGGTQCNYASPVTGTRATTALLSAGRPVYYSIEAVYFVSSLDLPIVPGTTSTTSGSTSGTTSGTTTSGTTSGTTATTSTTGASTTGSSATTGSTGTTSTAGTSSGSGTTSGTVENCYFQSGRSSSGLATPLNRPVLGTRSGTETNFTFLFTSTQGTTTFTQQAILEFSDSPTFPSQFTVATPATFGASFANVDTQTAPFSTKKGSTGALLSVASTIYYRVGIRNSADNPGPVKDAASGRRFIYSNTGSFTRASTPPSSPSAVRKT